MGIDFGDMPTWLATIGAGVAAYFAYGAYKIESDRDERQIEEMGRQQASQVAIWPERRDHPTTGMPDEVELFSIRNASDLPVYDVRVFAYSYRWNSPDQTTPWGWFDLRTVPPGDEPHRHLVGIEAKPFVFALDFRDSAGRTWHRDRLGRLGNDLLSTDGFEAKYVADPDDLY